MGAQWLSKIYERMHAKLLKQKYLYANDLQVLHESSEAAETKSYMWLYRTGRYCPPIVLCEYQQTQSKEYPIRDSCLDLREIST